MRQELKDHGNIAFRIKPVNHQHHHKPPTMKKFFEESLSPTHPYSQQLSYKQNLDNSCFNFNNSHHATNRMPPVKIEEESPYIGKHFQMPMKRQLPRENEYMNHFPNQHMAQHQMSPMPHHHHHHHHNNILISKY